MFQPIASTHLPRPRLFLPLVLLFLITTLFAFRFRAVGRRRWLVAYFAFFVLAEWWAQRTLLPPGALGYEVAWVCAGLGVLFCGAIAVQRRMEADSADP